MTEERFPSMQQVLAGIAPSNGMACPEDFLDSWSDYQQLIRELDTDWDLTELEKWGEAEEEVSQLPENSVEAKLPWTIIVAVPALGDASNRRQR